MNFNSLINAWHKTFSGGASRFVLPDLALEIEPHFVAGAQLDTSRHALRRVGMKELRS